MPKPKTLEVTFRPSFKEPGSVFWSTSFWLFNDTNKIVETFTVTTADELAAAIKTKAAELGEPAPVSGRRNDENAEGGWSIGVRPDGRWPNGFKARFDRSFIVKAAA